MMFISSNISAKHIVELFSYHNVCSMQRVNDFEKERIESSDNVKEKDCILQQ